jgi:hypothetical protein
MLVLLYDHLAFLQDACNPSSDRSQNDLARDRCLFLTCGKKWKVMVEADTGLGSERACACAREESARRQRADESGGLTFVSVRAK